ncbi:hypothetical protein K438DRAFT_1929846 [Mycena galopus ATCC 62051]|nr:hypothetical protein K438DRAFT_1929846 [Mycena galopus ATCC 62051]
MQIAIPAAARYPSLFYPAFTPSRVALRSVVFKLSVACSLAIGSSNSSSNTPTTLTMVQLSTAFVTLCAAACALAGAAPAKRQTPVPQCAADTVQYLFWVNTLGGVLQSSSGSIAGAEALAMVGILNEINLSLVNAVANGNSVAQTGFSTNVGPIFDEANKLLANNTDALTVLANAQSAVKSIVADLFSELPAVTTTSDCNGFEAHVNVDVNIAFNRKTDANSTALCKSLLEGGERLLLAQRDGTYKLGINYQYCPGTSHEGGRDELPCSGGEQGCSRVGLKVVTPPLCTFQASRPRSSLVFERCSKKKNGPNGQGRNERRVHTGGRKMTRIGPRTRYLRAWARWKRPKTIRAVEAVSIFGNFT